MEQEEASMREKEAVQQENTLVSESFPKLNLRRLEGIQRMLQYASVVVSIVLIALIAFFLFGLSTINQEITNKQTESNTQSQQIANQQSIIEKNKELIALQNANIKGQQAVINGLTETTRLISKENPKQGKQLQQTIENNFAQESDAKLIPARIYIQIADDTQRGRAADVGRQLQNKGFLVPGIENVHDKAPSDISELRTCGKNDDTTKKDLNDLLITLKSLKITSEPKFLRNCDKVNPRQYELWFSKEF